MSEDSLSKESHSGDAISLLKSSEMKSEEDETCSDSSGSVSDNFESDWESYESDSDQIEEPSAQPLVGLAIGPSVEPLVEPSVEPFAGLAIGPSDGHSVDPSVDTSVDIRNFRSKKFARAAFSKPLKDLPTCSQLVVPGWALLPS
jgi:hypothetical protein